VTRRMDSSAGEISRFYGKPYDVREVIARIVDGSRMHECQRSNATLATG
jgi:acetyl-CoA carboxylase carboxyltransferase component